MNIYLNKNTITEKNLSNHAFATYVGLALLQKKGLDLYCVNSEILSYYLYGSQGYGRRFKSYIQAGLEELISLNMIKRINTTAKYFVVDLQELNLSKDDNFVIINKHEINTIMSSKHKARFNLLRYYSYLIGTLISSDALFSNGEKSGHKRVVGMQSQKFLSTGFGISEHTVSEYTKLLEQLRLLYVVRSTSFTHSSNQDFINCNNVYGRFSNKALIDEYCSVHLKKSERVRKIVKAKHVNQKRSLAQKYNCLMNGYRYDPATVSAIYAYVKEYNDTHPKQYHKDMSIFQNLNMNN